MTIFASWEIKPLKAACDAADPGAAIKIAASCISIACRQHTRIYNHGGNPCIQISAYSSSLLDPCLCCDLMYYLNLETFFNQPDADLKIMLAEAAETPPETKENP